MANLLEDIVQAVRVRWQALSCGRRARAGDERPGAVPADIVFVIEEKPHPVFAREGNDLVYTARLPLVDALCGATVRLTTLDGRQLTVRSTLTPTPAPFPVMALVNVPATASGQVFIAPLATPSAVKFVASMRQ